MKRHSEQYYILRHYLLNEKPSVFMKFYDDDRTVHSVEIVLPETLFINDISVDPKTSGNATRAITPGSTK